MPAVPTSSCAGPVRNLRRPAPDEPVRITFMATIRRRARALTHRSCYPRKQFTQSHRGAQHFADELVTPGRRVLAQRSQSPIAPVIFRSRSARRQSNDWLARPTEHAPDPHTFLERTLLFGVLAPRHGVVGPTGRDDVRQFSPHSSIARAGRARGCRPSQLDRLADEDSAFQEYIMTLEPVLVAVRQTSELEERQRLVEGTG